MGSRASSPRPRGARRADAAGHRRHHPRFLTPEPVATAPRGDGRRRRRGRLWASAPSCRWSRPAPAAGAPPRPRFRSWRSTCRASSTVPHVEWKRQYPGVEALNVAVMGCIVNGPGESKHADIGISLPGTGETPDGPGVYRRQEGRDLARAHRCGRFQEDGDRLHRAALWRGARGRPRRSRVLNSSSVADRPFQTWLPHERLTAMDSAIFHRVSGISDIIENCAKSLAK